MIINGSSLNEVELNGNSNTDILFGNAKIILRQIVEKPKGSVSLSLNQLVKEISSCNLKITQNVFSVDSVNYSNWSIRVTVNNIDISSDLTGTISIDCERNSARIAVFNILLSGPVNPNDWIGKPVTIDYIQNDQTVWRRFTGIITIPIIDITNNFMVCKCSDDLQRIIDGIPNDEILNMTGGSWSKAVFSENLVGWQYLQDVLKTVPVSVERNSSGVIKSNNWRCKFIPDYSYDENIIDDQSLDVSLVQRQDLINSVDIIFDARFERLFHRQSLMQWVHNVDFCENYADPILFPTKSMVRSAIESAGWTMLTELYSAVWPTGPYTCTGPILWANVDPDLIRQFNIKAAYRWQQSVTRQFKINVSAPLEIAKHGLLKVTLQGAIDFTSDVENWSDTADLSIPEGFKLDDNYNYYKDEIDNLSLDNSVKTIIQTAIQTIEGSYRTNLVKFSLPLAPYLELSDTIEINTPKAYFKGVTSRIIEQYDLDTAEATSLVSLALSGGSTLPSALDNVVNSFTYSLEGTPFEEVVFPGVIDVPTHLGGKVSSPILNENDWGVITNYEVLEVDGEIYPREVRLKFDSIPDSKTQNIIDAVEYNITIQVPEDTLQIII